MVALSKIAEQTLTNLNRKTKKNYNVDGSEIGLTS